MTATTKRQAFLEQAKTVCGREFRPITGGTLLALAQTGNILLDQGMVEKYRTGKYQQGDVVSALAQFLLLHTAPIKEVQALSSDRDKMAEELIQMADTIDAGQIESLAVAVNDYLEEVGATKDWEVADTSTENFTPPSGRQSTAG